LIARKPLDLLKDHLAFQAFSLGNLLTLWAANDATGMYFFMPFVAINLAIRREVLSLDTRLNLLGSAFDVFFKMMKEFPPSRGRGALKQIGPASQRKTLWTQTMCVRMCNLCVGLYHAITQWGSDPGFRLALGRIVSHTVECHFGMTRSTCRGDA
jgi:hypothetical protein